jgi:hypothetical protein
VIARFTAISDLIVVGQRGIGSSKPNTLRENGPAFLASQRCRTYWDSLGLDLSGFIVIEAAADVRDAARAVLSGMEGPDHTYDRPTGILNAIRRYAAEAERSPAVRTLFPGRISIACTSAISSPWRGGAPPPRTRAPRRRPLGLLSRRVPTLEGRPRRRVP